jgi:hypothetical protein
MKGNILANWIYLIVFLGLYVLSITQLQNVLGILESAFPTLYADIPNETWFLLNLLAYVIVPLGAIAWTILASSPEQSYRRF